MPELVPIDHDPFASSPSVQFMPVDHDPFASNQDSALAASMTHWPEQPPDATARVAGRITQWPGAIGRGIVDAAMTGPRLMRDVMERRIDPNSPEAIRRGADTALSPMCM